MVGKNIQGLALNSAGGGEPARGGAKLFHLFDDEHFDGHIGGHQFEAELIENGLLNCFSIGVVRAPVVPFKNKVIFVRQASLIYDGNIEQRRQLQIVRQE